SQRGDGDIRGAAGVSDEPGQSPGPRPRVERTHAALLRHSVPGLLHLGRDGCHAGGFSPPRLRARARRRTSGGRVMSPAGRIEPAPWMRAPATRAVMEALAREGGAARFVGGCVRDAVLGRPVEDVDIATTHPPEKVMELLRAAG